MSSPDPDIELEDNDSYIDGKYEIIKHIGDGSFGDVFLGKDVSTGHMVAIKVEKSVVEDSALSIEANIYSKLGDTTDFPKMHYYGKAGERNVLVIDLLGPSLKQLFSYCNGKFSLKTVLMLMDQMISRIEYLHSKNFIHRDLKPANICMGTGSNSKKLFLIDFGLAKEYQNPYTGAHITYREDKDLSGTADFASLGSLLGIEQSRRDDIESAGFIMIYFLLGKLPWQGIKANAQQNFLEVVVEKKLSTPMALLCMNLPVECFMYFNYCHALSFEDKPDYEYLRRLLRQLFRKLGNVYDGNYDWDAIMEE